MDFKQNGWQYHKDEEEKDNSPMTLKLITGGKGPPSTDGNWFTDMDIGTLFLVQAKARSPQSANDFNLGLFKLVGKEGATQRVMVLACASVPEPLYVDPVRFTNVYNLYEVLGVQKQEEDPKDEEKSDE